ncbi:hypothetical protein CC78DRAFT_547690 [Lojkania enalia]|uniref:Uncharacterized protein n=1 Tax=Lojkania enalia TaxID=147567 RepID=A0A9P4K155_9PLEO|nr:hypothetical protein CC78DRAFT_547690 [Didymosphaeria enalia]
MSLIGQVFNKALSKSISVYIAESGDGFKRLTGAIGQDVKEAAFAKVKESNMSHQSKGDPNAHYSVQGETAAGSKVKGGHVTEDASKQTVSFLSILCYQSLPQPPASQLSASFVHCCVRKKIGTIDLDNSTKPDDSEHWRYWKHQRFDDGL